MKSAGSSVMKSCTNAVRFATPVPLRGKINTPGKGVEDSPFVLPDGQTMYLWYTPDAAVPPERQLLDGVTGIYVSQRTPKNRWSPPQRVWLQDPGKLALDGCAFVSGNWMYFCSSRQGYTGIHWFRARYRNGKWRNWQLAKDVERLGQVGELHFDGADLYFERNGDLYVAKNLGAPQRIAAVATPAFEFQPCVRGDELWFTRIFGPPSIYRSRRVAGAWQPPELVVSGYVGEPTLDAAGNLYFTHVIFEGGQKLGADLYVATKQAASD